MIRNKTVFVLGAGASKEIGLPTGAELKGVLAGLLQTQLEELNNEVALQDIVSALIQSDLNIPTGVEIDKALETAIKTIRRALPTSNSIDQLLHIHSNNLLVTHIGKYAIAKAILNAEKNSELYSSTQDDFSWQKIEGTWYRSLFRLLTSDVGSDDVSKIFDNVSFVSFNYDRCIEHFLAKSLEILYPITVDEAESIVSRLEVVHPYGQIGFLPWQQKELQVPYGGAADLVQHFEMSRSIKTFTEQAIDDATRLRMRHLIAGADTLVFLGFGFHQMNMELIAQDAENSVRQIFSTTFGMSPNDRSIFAERIKNQLKVNADCRVTMEQHQLACAGLFEHYGMSLS